MNDLEGLIRIGRVSSIDPKEATVRVLFDDRDHLVSYDMRVVVPVTLKDKAYYMPSINERVLCVLLPNDPTQGFILGSFYSDGRQPPVQDENKFHMRFEDGTTFDYDKKEKVLSIHCVGDVYVNTEGESVIYTVGNASILTDSVLNVRGAKEVNVSSGSPVNISAGSTVDMSSVGAMTLFAQGAMNIKSGSGISLNAPSISLN